MVAGSERPVDALGDRKCAVGEHRTENRRLSGLQMLGGFFCRLSARGVRFHDKQYPVNQRAQQSGLNVQAGRPAISSTM